MLWNASALKGYQIAATDGDVGHVADLYIDPKTWSVRWLIVETGTWLNQRAVCLPAWALARPDPEKQNLAVNLTRLQIETSPGIDGDRGLSRDRESTIDEHYRQGLAPAATDQQLDVGTPVRANLVSLNVLTNATVEALDGEIGHIESLIVDPDLWVIRYLVVHTGAWWADRKVLILPDLIARFDDIRASIDLTVDRAKVRSSPDYIDAETVDGAYDEQFHIYYGVKWMRK